MKEFLEPDLRIIIFKTEDILANDSSTYEEEPGLEEDDLPIG